MFQEFMMFFNEILRQSHKLQRFENNSQMELMSFAYQNKGPYKVEFMGCFQLLDSDMNAWWFPM